ncbi:MAG TPA: hypothetical protein VJN70_05730 [Gemmatimonadaceae bacterium]|nr:hypothetical protein [Gemmatimonadaceae bacterium]
MYGIVPIEALGQQTLKSINSRRQLFDELAFNDRVDSGVQLGLREIYTGVPMIGLDKRNLLAIIEREPFGWIRRDIGVVSHADAKVPTSASS